MIKKQAFTVELRGTNYEIGWGFGEFTKGNPALRAVHTAGFDHFDEAEAKQAAELFDRWCPGLAEELRGFADALEAKPSQIVYYAMTYLRPRCSQIAVLPGISASGNPLLARNYEFSPDAEDFTLVKTSVTGKYAHLGTSVLHFGRDDGFNECGLAVTMSSCGFPVGALPYMRSPKLTGLQFWAVIRALLENCKDVPEALDYMKDMPIAFNMNLMLVDKSGRAALAETLDGRMAVRQIDRSSADQLLYATNHPLLPELVPYEPQAMRNSLQRYELIGRSFQGKGKITEDDLKQLLLGKFPAGLSCSYYEDFFGTTKSMIMNQAKGTVELCWGGRSENGWHRYDIREPLADSVVDIELYAEAAYPEFFESVPISAS
ncbi:C45 family peptidase [Paenibacillus macerans]|uniref:C45 family autoproteolytic acyltransferase/hydolase n=1 Tax=Paenibacillus macerans TaxID=44252 RepID=UPI00203B5D8E|nr:C45 family peptidase [Paenibacillus macerans]MCM3702558.1 C45 family peptidase [Paenibacillus macerans]